MGNTTYHKDTLESVKSIIERNIHTNNRLRFWFGDYDTGYVWQEDNDVTGYLGRTTGNHSPILLANRRSLGGGLILTHKIMAIAVNGCMVWKHTSFIMPTYTTTEDRKTCSNHTHVIRVLSNNITEASFTTLEKAQRWIDFMTGKRKTR